MRPAPAYPAEVDVGRATRRRYTENVRCAAAAGGPRRRPSITLLPTERPPGKREEQAGVGAGRGTLVHPWTAPRMWGERQEYSQWAEARSIRSSCQSRCGKPNLCTCARYPRDQWSLRSSPACTTSRTRSPATPAPRSAPPASSCASTGCVTASRCRTSAMSTGCSPSAASSRSATSTSDPLQTAEAALLGEAVERGIPVLGVCLGAQLLAHALGAPRVPAARSGSSLWTPIEPLPAAAGDPVVGSLPGRRRRAALERGRLRAARRARSSCCARPGLTTEAFRYGDCAWGVQFHPEVHAEGLDGWYRAGLDELPEAGVTEEQARALDARHLPGQQALAERAVRRLRPRGGGAHIAGGGRHSLASSLREHRVP